MQIDAGLAIVIVAVLIFYLRLIVLQRERAQQANQQPRTPGKGKGKSAPPAPALQFSIASRNRRDWIIASAGILLILIGILMARNIIPYPWAQANWWLPVSVGILAFSWGFK
jgi:hypothetical protein